MHPVTFVLLLRLVIQWYQNQYLMTYIDRTNKEKGIRKRVQGKKIRKKMFSLFDIRELKHLID